MEADAEEVVGGAEGDYDDGMQEGEEEVEGGEEVQTVDDDDDNDVVIVGTCTRIAEVDLTLKKKKTIHKWKLNNIFSLLKSCERRILWH